VTHEDTEALSLALLAKHNMITHKADDFIQMQSLLADMLTYWQHSGNSMN